MTRSDPGARRRRQWPIVAVFVGIVALQLTVTALSIEVLGAVRAYVNGESLYSKAQKDAHERLISYIEYRHEDDYQGFERALALPLGDRVAREALLQPRPDVEAARRGFLAGGNHAGDIDSMVRLFVWFERLPFMAAAIATWTDGDELIARMHALGREAQRLVSAGVDAAALAPIRQQVRDLNDRLSGLETRFSEQLGHASRQTQRLLIIVNVVLALLLCATGLAFVRRSARTQSHTDEALRRREESLQRLLDSAAEGLYGVDMNGRCTFINRAALQMLGYAREDDLLGSDIHQLLLHRGPAGDATPVANPTDIASTLRQNRRVHLPVAVFWRRDGTSFPAECWSHPVLEGDVTQGAVVTFVDISDRVKMEAALRAGELRVLQLMDVVIEGVITIDAADRVVFFNRAAEHLFGVSSSSAKRSRIDRLIASAQGAPVPFGAMPAGVVELRGIAANGRVFPIEVSVSRLDTDTGPLLTIVLRDVTEQHAIRAERRAREAHEAASRAKTEFLSRMSHELRTPLNAVLGFSNLLRLDKRQPPTLQQLERIQHIENAGAHLLALVNDVLDLSRVESGQMLVALEPVALRPAVLESFGLVASLATERSVSLLMDSGAQEVGPPPDAAVAGGDDGPWVVADPVRLRQVIVNLLSNAVKYNHAGGQVTLSYRVDDTSCAVRIADTGVGIETDQLDSLFEPFNRLGAEKTGVEGTGIGLVLSRRLTELMGGSLAIESEVGHGTTATLTLRLSPPEAAAPPEAAPPTAHAPINGHLEVLYVEDDPVNAELVRQVLGLRSTVSLRIAESGARAMVLAKERVPDLMLVDMNLGDMTGRQLAHLLRLEPKLRAVRLVALSADALPEQIASAMDIGFERYMTKPVDFHDLMRLVDCCARQIAGCA